MTARMMSRVRFPVREWYALAAVALVLSGLVVGDALGMNLAVISLGHSESF